MALLHEMPEILIVSQAAVHPSVILRVIPVARGLKKRADVGGRKAQILHMINPRVQITQPVNRLLSLILPALWRSQKPQRINMIKNGFLVPF